MRKTITTALLLISFLGFGQVKNDTLKIPVVLSFEQMQFVYMLVDKSDAPHKKVVDLLNVFSEAYIQASKQDSINTKKKP